MEDSRVAKIRLELKRSPPPTVTQLQRKYRINRNLISSIRQELGLSVPRSDIPDRVRTAIESDPGATSYVIAQRLGLHPTTVAKYRRRLIYDVLNSELNQDSEKGQSSKGGDWKHAARELRAQGKRVREIARELGRNSGDISKAVRGITPGKGQPRARPLHKSRPPPNDPDQEVQWMWRQIKELRISLKYTLRRMEDMDTWLTEITQIIDQLRPYEPWVRYYTEGTPGYGSLPVFLAERSELDLDTLITRIREAGERYYHLLSIIGEEETEVEVYTNGRSTDKQG